MFSPQFELHAATQIEFLRLYSQNYPSNQFTIPTELPNDFFKRYLQVVDVSYLNSVVSILCDFLATCEIGTAFAVGFVFLYLQK